MDSQQNLLSGEASTPASGAPESLAESDSESGSGGQILAFGVLVSDIIAGFLALMRAEMRYSVGKIPEALGLWLLKLPLVFLAWISLSGLVSWLVYMASDRVWCAFLACFLLQCLAWSVVVFRLSRLREAMSMPTSRQLLYEYSQLIKDEYLSNVDNND